MKETEGTLALAQDPQPLRPVELRTPRDYLLLTTAIEHRSEELEKLIKKNREEGYAREAAVMEADNEALKHQILPQVRAQQELPLASAEEVRAGIANGIRDIVRDNIVVREENGKVVKPINLAVQELCSRVSIRVEAYVEQVAKDAYAAGYAAREAEPLLLAKRALGALYE